MQHILKHHDLFGAELNADITGDHGMWRSISALAAQQRLMSPTDFGDEVAALAEGLDGLRRCGSRESLKLAMRHLRCVGPLDAVKRVVNKIPVNGWTHTTAGRNLDALALAGDLVEEHTAAQHLCRLARLVGGETEDFIARVRPNFVVPHFAADALVGLLPSVEGIGHSRVARLVASLPIPTPEFLPSRITNRIVQQLDFDQVTAADREALWLRGQRDPGYLGSDVVGWLAANGHPDARRKLIDRAAGGDPYALAALRDVHSLESTDVASIIEACENLVQDTLRDARSGSHHTGPDHCSALARLNLWFPDQARWDEVISLLLEPRVAPFWKLPTAWVVAEEAAELPAEVRTAVSQNIDAVTTAETRLGNASGMEGVGVVLTIALGITEGSDADTAAALLAAGTPQQREHAAMLLGSGYCPASRPILAALVRDRHSDVRYRAAEAVGRLAVATQDKLYHTLASDMAHSDGTLLPVALLNGISAEVSTIPSSIERIATFLLQHPSAQIRNYARHLLST